MDTDQIAEQATAPSKKFSKKQIIILLLIVSILVIVGVYFVLLITRNNFTISGMRVFTPTEEYIFDEPMISEDSSAYNYTLIKLDSDGQNQEIEFVNNELDIWNLSPGENSFLLVKSSPDGSTQDSRVFKIFYDEPKVEYVEETINQESQGQQPDVERQEESSKTEGETPEETSKDNGDGTYTLLKGGNPIKQYRFYDHKEVVAKCRDEATNFNTIVFVENGVGRVDIDCRGQDQVCTEFVNEEGKADAKCE